MKIQEHINKKEFKLKDFDKTFNKYKNYKQEQTDRFFKDNKEDIKRYVGGTLFYLVFGELEHRIKNFNYMGFFEKSLNKSMVNQLMTLINGITYDKNMDFIKELDSLNKNEIKSFAIILYLKNYNKINSIMKKVLIEFLKDYDKKTISNKL